MDNSFWIQVGSQGNIQLKKNEEQENWKQTSLAHSPIKSLYTEKRLNIAIDFSRKVFTMVMGSSSAEINS